MKILTCIVGLALAGCAMAATGQQPGMVAVDDPRAELERLIAGTTPSDPTTIRFGWSIDEPDLRARGDGVLRMDAPERLRLDLFGPRGDTYIVAALVSQEYRLPAGAAGGELPPPALLWAALGVVRPPPGADARVFTDAPGSAWSVEFDVGDETVRINGRHTHRPVVESASIEQAGRTIATLDHRADDDGTPRRAVYRDRPEARTLTFEIDRVEASDPFSSEIWRVGR